MMVLIDVDTGMFVESYDPDFLPPPPHPTFPSGFVKFTRDKNQAMRFVDSQAALTTWMAQSVTVPWRPDGEPNRPLSGRTMLLLAEEDPS